MTVFNTLLIKASLMTKSFNNANLSKEKRKTQIGTLSLVSLTIVFIATTMPGTILNGF